MVRVTDDDDTTPSVGCTPSPLVVQTSRWVITGTGYRLVIDCYDGTASEPYTVEVSDW